MEFKQYTCVQEFHRDVYEILVRHEGQNMILLGNIMMALL